MSFAIQSKTQKSTSAQEAVPKGGDVKLARVSCVEHDHFITHDKEGRLVCETCDYLSRLEDWKASPDFVEGDVY